MNVALAITTEDMEQGCKTTIIVIQVLHAKLAMHKLSYTGAHDIVKANFNLLLESLQHSQVAIAT